MGQNTRILLTQDDGTVIEAPGDETTGAMHVTQTDHFRIHRGDAYDFSEIISLGAGATLYLLGKCGSMNIHFRNFSVSASNGPIDITLFEAPTITADGTQVTPVNRNRAKANIPTFEVYTGATISADGTQLFTTRNFSDSSFFFSTTSQDVQAEEWVLAANTNYIIKLENTAGAGADVSASFFWYEENPT